ncbi:MAG: LeuA family protein [Candidatus Krumholzibacteriia bacterium]
MAHDSASMDERALIYDWNEVEAEASAVAKVEFDDETLRDGLQSPSATDPPIGEKIELLHLMVELGIDAADIGLPGAGPRAQADVAALAKEIANEKLPITANCAARTVVADIDPIVAASQAAGVPIGASLFIGSSPIREYVENWTLDQMLEKTETAVSYAVKQGLPVMFVTEDTTRANPESLRRLYSTAISCGARRICVADTVGHATIHGTKMLIRFIKGVVDDSGEAVKIDWHGHNDRGLSVANSIAAILAGANRVHGTGLGVGERCGNAPMELLLTNLRLLGYIDNDLSRLSDYCELVSRACKVTLPFNQPVVGPDAFLTCTGVHAAAVVKAMKKGHDWLANRVYSSVPADWVGRQQGIEIGPMSGASNVIHWLSTRGYDPQPPLVEAILTTAKTRDRRLTGDEIQEIIHSLGS